jgi:hypothetical protein
MSFLDSGIPGPMTTARPPFPSSSRGMPDRHADRSGGPPAQGWGGRFIQRFMDFVTLTREGVNANEAGVQHERFPYYQQPYLGSHHDTLVNWTDSGPVRPTLHNRQVTVARQQGTSNTRNLDPHPVIAGSGMQDQGHGMHTNPERSKKAVNRNFRAKVQMQPAYINRLSPARNFGQSYSGTTTIQGG